MGFVLRPGVSFCVTGNRPIFLDVTNDRYFCLAGEAERAFIALVERREADQHHVQTLRASGLLVRGMEGELVRPTVGPASPTSTLLDTTVSATMFRTTQALADIGKATLCLKARGLSALLGGFARAKSRLRTQSAREEDILSVVAGFNATRYLVGEHDRCLVRSFAIGRRVLACRARADVVIGVKLQPFKAHCWAQLGDRLVNDRQDIVREFTPILVL